MTVIACFVLSFAMTGIATAIALPAMNSGILAREPKTDAVPLSLSDLTDRDPDGLREQIRHNETVLLGQRTVTQQLSQTTAFPGEASFLMYTVTTVKVPAFYQWCKGQYLDGDLTGVRSQVQYTLAEAEPWGAEEAYRQLDENGNPKTSFLLFYERTIVLIHLDWEPTRSQMTVVGQKLGS